MSDSDVLDVDIDSQICTITLSRPDKMNALNEQLLGQLWHTAYELQEDDDVRVVVLTGAGDKAFCAGADLEERREMSESDTRRRIRDYKKCFGAFEELPKPVIAAVNGYAFGGGLELALCCDIRLVAQDTKVGLTETKLGIIPGAGGTQRLPRVVGLATAKRLIYTGARITGEKAVDIGLASEACPADELLDEAHSLAEEMLDSAPIALGQAKKAMNRGIETDLQTGLAIENEAYEVTLGTEDRIEGLEAFKEGRKPDFKGK